MTVTAPTAGYAATSSAERHGPAAQPARRPDVEAQWSERAETPEAPEPGNPVVVAVAALVGIVVFVTVRVAVEQFTGLDRWWSAGLAMPLSLAALLAAGTVLDALLKAARAQR